MRSSARRTVFSLPWLLLLPRLAQSLSTTYGNAARAKRKAVQPTSLNTTSNGQQHLNSTEAPGPIKLSALHNMVWNRILLGENESEVQAQPGRCVGPDGLDASLDFIVPTERLDCRSRFVISSLQRWASPRRIFVIAPESGCNQSSFEPDEKVYCVDESTVIPGVSKDSIQEWFTRRFGETTASVRFGAGGHKLAGWYFQQFLKMGVVEETAKNLNLSDNYVIWDSDMILVRHYCPFNEKGEVNFMAGDYGRENVCNKAYASSYSELTGLDLAFSKGAGKSFVPHHMVVNQEHMRSFLMTISQGNQGNHSLLDKKPTDPGSELAPHRHWFERILEAACPNLRTCSCGFSEYGSYASFVQHEHPESFSEVPSSFQRPHYRSRTKPMLACPQLYPDYFRRKRQEGLLFIGFEAHGSQNFNTQLPR